MQHTLIVPDSLYQATHFLERNWTAIVGIVIVALLSCIVTEAVKHKVSLSQEQDRAKKVVRWTLLAVSAGFTTLGYVIFFLQQNDSFLKQLPVVGQSVVEVLGVAWTLYNFRLNKTFQNVTQKLTSWSGAKATVPAAQPQSSQSASEQANLSQFQVQ